MQKFIDIVKSNDFSDLKKTINDLDLTEQSTNIRAPSHRGYHKGAAGEEHYKLLAYFSKMFTGETIYDIGTFLGNSSLALGFNQDTTVVSYDIVNLREVIAPPANIEYKLGDFREDPKVLESPLILVDVDPHDGIQEQAFHEFFLAKNYKGIVVWDDINLTDMKPWWDSLTDVDKYDITPIGHHSGTGLIVY